MPFVNPITLLQVTSQPLLSGIITLAAGSNMTLTQVGSTITFAASGGGGVTEVDTGTGLTGGPITTTGTVSLASIANHDLLANISGGSAAPTATTLTALIDNAIGSTQGDILYRNSTVWTVLAPGTSGQFLQTQGASANPQWASGGGGLTGNTSASSHTSLTQSLSSTAVAIQFDVNDYNVGAMWSGGSDTRLTAPAAGKYHFTANVDFSNAGAGAVTAVFKLNGTTLIGGSQLPTNSSGETFLSIGVDRSLSINDYVEVFAANSAGGNISANNFNTSFSAFLMSD